MFSNAIAISLLCIFQFSSFVHAEENDPPDFSSFQYSGAPRIRSQPEYDFCIVGGGTAGLTLANRLTESGRFNVVVFEAGGSPEQVATYKTAGGNQFVLNGAWSLLDYNFETVPQVHLNNRTLNYHRGRALGGSSATNGLFYGLGSREVYDQWERDGNPGWNWTTIQRAAKRGTVFVGNPENTNDNTYMTWDPNNYGTKGPLKIGFQGYVPESNPSFMNATEAIGLQVVEDQNGGNPIGIKQGTIHADEKFERSSSYDSYYQAAKDRPNLDVLERAIVSRIIFAPNDNSSYSDFSEPEAIGVTFIDGTSGIFHNVSCNNEVIVSAGAFHSPFILKHSGIGPADELTEFGIPVVVGNENVGENMHDHTSFSVIHAVKPEFADVASTTDLVNDIRILNEEQRKFYTASTLKERAQSKWSAPSGATNGFQKIPADELRAIGAGAIIDAGWADQAHNEILYESVWYPQSFTEYGQPQQNTSYFSVTVSNLAALSQGSVRLGSNFALSDPVIDPNYLAEEADRAMAIQGVKYLRQVAAHPALQQWSAGEVLPGSQYQSDEELLEYARLHMIPNWHASNTCRMLPRENGGVVDSHMRVYGTRRLRVCDVSILGRLPDVNLVGPVYAVAELGAEIIRKEYNDWTEDEH
ncbi:hypothetical protein CKM354_000061100 [Cercospora kikuchii]|uniref:Glucose-methanol-choline oxidoreductase N-terminal domain-containing protein n=1 Tax=Cercospora kikuchii TaxID=84275 RepID=A0A9P3CEB1_9PEZI|nr:uncharacterized protein CKM354_000061100 [Cercospora kikuchii]GIZ37153.1 hypothetical protein CKM354_000061100 [Cercospora kikuchii]